MLPTLSWLAAGLAACVADGAPVVTGEDRTSETLRSPSPPATPPARPDPFEAWLRVDGPVATAIAASPGPGWAPEGEGWVAETSQPVRAPAAGRVVAADAGRLRLRVVAYENHRRHDLELEIQGIEAPVVRAGADVAAGAELGRATRVHVREDGAGRGLPELAALRLLPSPTDEPVLVIIDQDRYELRLYRRGVEASRMAVSFGQGVGAKERRGDNRTPVGAYHVVARSRGPFPGPTGPYYGGHWIKLNYPNPWDARRGVERGWIDAGDAARIDAAWSRRALTPQDTPLGGGIGLHGWAYEWSDDGPRHLSWGCVVLHLADVAGVYDALPAGALVVIRGGDDAAG